MEETHEAKQHNLPVEQILVLPKVKELVPAVQEAILSGTYDPLKFQIFLKKIGKLGEEVLKGEKGKDIDHLVFEEIKKYQIGKTSEIFGTKIIEQSRSYHNYVGCGDPVWEELTRIQAKIKVLLKARETELKALIVQADPTDDAFGVGEKAKILVPYYPKFIKEETTDVVFVNPPEKGARRVLAFHL